MRSESVLSAIALLCLSGAAHADDNFRFNHNGLRYRSSDRNVELTLGGRLHLDAASIQSDNAATNEDEEVRRARLELAGEFFKKLRVRIDREFTHDGAWRNVWVSYNFTDNFIVRGGNFIAPFSMEDGQSSNDLMFMERGLEHALSPGFGQGVGAMYRGGHWQIAGGYFTDAIDDEDETSKSKGDGVAVRASVNLARADNQVLHFGVGLQDRDFNGGDTLRYSARPESHLAPIVVRSGVIANPESSFGYNLEAAWSNGPVTVQAQYISSDVNRSAGGDLNFDGYHVQAAWVLTGEAHGYSNNSGAFTGVRPRRDWGAVELAARYSSLDTRDVAVGARANNATAGVNWYIGRNVRFMANYVHSEIEAVNPALDDQFDIFEARAQVNF